MDRRIVNSLILLQNSDFFFLQFLQQMDDLKYVPFYELFK